MHTKISNAIIILQAQSNYWSGISITILHTITPVSPNATGQTGIPNRSDRSYIDTGYPTSQTGSSNWSDQLVETKPQLSLRTLVQLFKSI